MNGLTETHVIGQDPARLEFFKEPEPSQPFLLVVAELALEPRRGLGRLDSIELENPTAEGIEAFIAPDIVVITQRSVEQQALRLVEAERTIFGLLTQALQGLIARLPFFGQKPQGAVLESHERTLSFERGENLFLT